MKQTSDHPSFPGYAAGKQVLVCVCGGISAYKVCTVVSRMVQGGAGVTVAMTRAARKFVGPATFEALTGQRVLTDLWGKGLIADSPHIRLTDCTDLVLVAPATANMMGKIAAGIADDCVSTLVISARPPVLLAPAMNERMWQSPPVQANVKRLQEMGYEMVGPGEGWLACKTVGTGRMAEAEEILEAVAARLCVQVPNRTERT